MTLYENIANKTLVKNPTQPDLKQYLNFLRHLIFLNYRPWLAEAKLVKEDKQCMNPQA